MNMSLKLISEYNQTYRKHTSCYYCLELTLCYIHTFKILVFLATWLERVSNKIFKVYFKNIIIFFFGDSVCES